MILKTIFWEITSTCNLKCSHCYLGETRNDVVYQFTKEQSLSYIDFLYKSGIKTILFMGGEPLLYPHIYEVIKKTGKFGYHLHAGVLTNGTLLNDRVVAKLKENGVGAIQISVDGVGDTYKTIRGVNFKIIEEGIKKLKENKISTLAKFTINKNNIKELFTVWEYCRENKISLSTSLILEAGRAKKNLIPEPNEYFDFFASTFKLRKLSKKGNKSFSLPDFSIEEYLQNGEPQTSCVAGRGVSGITKNNKFVPCIYLSGLNTRKLFGIDAPEFDEYFERTFNEHPLFTLFRDESSRYFGCPIRKRIYGGKDPFSVYEFAKKSF